MFKGSIVAIITPFTKDNKIDKKALFDLVEWHIENKSDAIVACGTTGESPTLSDEEKLEIIKICVEASKGRVPVIAGTGTYDTSKSFYLTKKAKELKASGCLVVVPYYNRPTQEGIFFHFKEIAKANLPIIAYHHPKRTGINVELLTFQRLSTIKNIVAVKEASGDLDFIYKLIEISSFPILSGDDSLTFPIMKRGGVGSISVVANVIPNVWKKFVSLLLEKNFKKATFLYKKYEKLVEAMTLETNPQCVKYALYLMKRCNSYIRLPLIKPKNEVKEKIKKALS
ncbi:MAG: hypothetical protein AMS24_05010 [Chlamydiae bacterium SM23_39]|nr:MAG: hypothetical protein AMS24_05010 [Chlamydiae bacterium SM23_39]